MADSKYDTLKLENQICFPLYAASREVIRSYKPYLDEIDLTYTQYVAMLFLWENKAATSKALGEALYLDSGTLTPLLKKLEAKGFVIRSRSEADERNLVVSLTPKGDALKEKALSVPGRVAQCSPLDPEDAAELYRILYKMLGKGDHDEA